MFQQTNPPLRVSTTGAAAEGSDGGWDCSPDGGSGPCPPAPAAEQGPAAAPGPAGAAVEGAGGTFPENDNTTTRAATAGDSSKWTQWVAEVLTCRRGQCALSDELISPVALAMMWTVMTETMIPCGLPASKCCQLCLMGQKQSSQGPKAPPEQPLNERLKHLYRC